jgi:hypothetical protein
LTIFKNVECASPGGSLSNSAVCEYVLDNVSPSHFRIIVTGNNPNPSILSGSSSGSEVKIGAGLYMVTENSSINSDIVAKLAQELSTTVSTTFSLLIVASAAARQGLLQQQAFYQQDNYKHVISQTQ